MVLRSRLITGTSGSGKSQGILSDYIGMVARGFRGFTLVEDPHGELSGDLILQLAEIGQLHRVLYDKLGSFERCLGLAKFQASDKVNAYDRKKDNARTINGMLRVIWASSQRDDDGALLTHPMTFRYVKFALSLILHQQTHVGLSWLPFCFMPRSQEFRHMMANCTDQQTFRVWDHIAQLDKKNSFTLIEQQLGGAQRLIETVMDMPELAARLDGNVEPEDLIKQGVIVILDGSDAEPDARTGLFRTWQSAVRDALDDNFARTLTPLECLIIADEAPASRSISLRELDFCREQRKKGGAMWICGQDLNYLSPEFMKSLKAVTPEHHWFRAADEEVALVAARDVGYATLDEYAVHHTEKELRAIEQKPGSRTSVTKSSNGKSTTTSKNNELIYGEVEKTHFLGLNDQILLKMRDILTMGPGWRYIKRPGYVSPRSEYCPMLEDPYPRAKYGDLRDRKIEQAIAISQERPEFHTPQVESTSTWTPPSQTTDSDNGGGRRLGKR